MHLQSDAAVLFLNTVLNSISPTNCGNCQSYSER